MLWGMCNGYFSCSMFLLGCITLAFLLYGFGGLLYLKIIGVKVDPVEVLGKKK